MLEFLRYLSKIEIVFSLKKCAHLRNFVVCGNFFDSDKSYYNFLRVYEEFLRASINDLYTVPIIQVGKPLRKNFRARFIACSRKQREGLTTP